MSELKNTEKYLQLNARAKIFARGKDNFHLDVEAAREYVESYIKPKFMQFATFRERIAWLVANEYYEKAVVSQFPEQELQNLYDYAWSFQHTFPSFMAALKFYNAYALKTFDGTKFLEHFTDRVFMNALLLGGGDLIKTKLLLRDMLLGRFQPATPTFLNAGKKQRGEYVSCYLLRAEDNMESIARVISEALQLSKRGGGVAICLTNLREFGAPIKQIANQATGVIPVMKILEDCFSYANQLGQRQGAGAVYLNVHHPDILSFLDTKRENADEKVRIKSLSLAVIVPDITFELAKQNKPMALFSPLDVERVYKKPLSDISITAEYEKMVANDAIKKTYISARKLFQTIAELHFESGYPFLLFDDNVNNRNAHPNRIVMSNLCSEIAQPNTASQYNADMSFAAIGQDVCCNLGSLNIAKVMESGIEFGAVVANAIEALDTVSRITDLSASPSIANGNASNHAVGLGAMNLHGFLATNKIYYHSEYAVEFTNLFFYTVAYHAFEASMNLAKKYGAFAGFGKTKFADGSYFAKYLQCSPTQFTVKSEEVKALFEKYKVVIPTQAQWATLVASIKKVGLANSHLMAIAPTGSISYISACTPSLQPVVAPVEVRKEGKLGRVYVPAYQIHFDNMQYYALDAYEMGPDPIINIAAAAQQHVDQAISLTLFFKDTATTRDLNRAYIKAFAAGCSSIYYVRVRQDVLTDSENYECDACTI